MNIEGFHLDDPLWRLDNLYKCRKEGVGTGIPFQLREEQRIIATHLIETPQVPAYIVKSRRLGMSTLVETANADGAVFRSGWRGQLIDQTQDDASRKMIEIVRFAIDSLPQPVLDGIVFDKRNDSELRLRILDEPDSDDSVIFAGTQARGGDANFLHISEWGPIAALDPKRSNEIRTGTFPSARMGRRVVETTWYGGRTGDLWELIAPLMNADPNAEGVIYFFPWWSDPAAIRTEGMLTVEVEDYFRKLSSDLSDFYDQAHKKIFPSYEVPEFTREQKLWWAAKKTEQGPFMNREYPSTLDEALSGTANNRRFDEGGLKVLRAEAEQSKPQRMVADANSDGSFTFRPVDEGQETFWVWEPARIGAGYLLAVDVMTGAGQVGEPEKTDHHAGLMIRTGYLDEDGRWHRPSIVARTAYPCRWDVDILEQHVWALAQIYGNCTIIPESNMDRGLILLLKKRGAVLYERDTDATTTDQKTPKKSGKYGFQTTGGNAANTRNWIIENLARAIREWNTPGAGIYVPDKRTAIELETFVVNEKGKAEALPGEHDDSVMALAIGLACLASATTMKARVELANNPRDIALAMEADRSNDRRSMYS